MSARTLGELTNVLVILIRENLRKLSGFIIYNYINIFSNETLEGHCGREVTRADLVGERVSVLTI